MALLVTLCFHKRAFVGVRQDDSTALKFLDGQTGTDISFACFEVLAGNPQVKLHQCRVIICLFYAIYTIVQWFLLHRGPIYSAPNSVFRHLHTPCPCSIMPCHFDHEPFANSFYHHQNIIYVQHCRITSLCASGFGDPFLSYSLSYLLAALEAYLPAASS